MSAKAILFALLCLSATSLSSLCQTTPGMQDQINQHTQLAQQYLRQQRPDLAIPELQAVIALEPENTSLRDVSVSRTVASIMNMVPGGIGTRVPHTPESMYAHWACDCDEYCYGDEDWIAEVLCQ